MDFFTLIVTWVVTAALTYFLAPKPKYNAPKAAGLGDFTVPTAQEGREIPVLFGTRDLAGPNVVWYGHLRVVPVRK